ncbi:cysteine hydrolase [Thermosipho atlanticus]|uniref:Isochorismate hydrolase n=1 Tax=Thermosipho atlanticus DSM 15807 TaxID=1123380 RepID=A0A1M5SF13_9BACT|nr:isochorismatase family protein [Thermosipho atlanticus]SHH37187.1 Isochorismate hydrolase [Thermosipho atlanticus DSM 15807]
MFFYKERVKHNLSLDTPALLIVDVQNYFFSPDSKAYLNGIENIFPNLIKLKDEFLKRNFPVICTIHFGGSNTMKNWWNNVISERWTKPYFNDRRCLFITKDTYDAFFKTKLEEYLKNNKVTDLLITGVMTHLCCETTARSAFVRGFNVIMIEDALWDKDEFYHFNSLKSLAHGFAIISKTEEVLCALE